MATLHLVAGPIGAGKTTYARKLADRVPGVRFSIDEWMLSLFGADMAAPLDPAWIFERVKRCNDRITDTALLLAATGIDPVLDLGFTRMSDRDAIAKAATKEGHEVKLHWSDAPQLERWARVEKRNEERGDTYSFPITRHMFDFMEATVEVPTAEEMGRLNGRHV